MSLNILHVTTPLQSSPYLSPQAANLDWLPGALRQRGHNVAVWVVDDPVDAVAGMQSHDYDAIHLHLPGEPSRLPAGVPRLVITRYGRATPCDSPWVALSHAEVRQADQWPAAVIAPALDTAGIDTVSRGDELVMSFDGRDFFALSAAIAVAHHSERPLVLVLPEGAEMTDEAAALIHRAQAVLRVARADLLWSPDELTGAACYLSFKHSEFDMAALSALAAGVPVVTLDGFPAAELIVHGESGYVARSVEDAGDYIERLGRLSPALGAQRARMLYDAGAAAMSHERLYEQLRRGELPVFRHPETDPHPEAVEPESAEAVAA